MLILPQSSCRRKIDPLGLFRGQ
uniref:Uncharacterized protein n=1 Tax=Anguilla anguilla TaxID=7936 RepID=A0A0E9T085_ANGAN